MPQHQPVKVSVESGKQIDNVNGKFKRLNATLKDTASTSADGLEKIIAVTEALENLLFQFAFPRPVKIAQSVLKEFAPLFHDVWGLQHDLDKASERWEKNLADMTPAQIKAQLDILKMRRDALLEEMGKFENRSALHPSPFGELGESLIPITHFETNARIEQINKDIERLADFMTRVGEIGEEGTETIQQNFQGTKVTRKAELPPIDVRGTMPSPEYAPTATPQSLFGGVELGKPKLSKVPTTPPEQSARQAKETFIELTALSKSFETSFLSGISSVQASIDQGIGGAFQKMFGEANSLLEIFIQNFLSSMASDILSVLTGGVSGGILKILGFAQGGIISEPIFGIGKSGQRYLFGEAGNEAVVPLSNMAASQATRLHGNGMIKPTVVVTPLVSSNGLAVQVEIGNRKNRIGELRY